MLPAARLAETSGAPNHGPGIRAIFLSPIYLREKFGSSLDKVLDKFLENFDPYYKEIYTIKFEVLVSTWMIGIYQILNLLMGQKKIRSA